MENTFENKITILGEVWDSARDDPAFQEMLEWHDFTFPLAWSISHKMAISTPKSVVFINGAYAALLGLLDIEDGIYEDYEEMTGSSDLD